MRTEPKEALKGMVAAKGERVAADPELCEALLRDQCGDCRREIASLVAAVRCGAAREVGDGSLPYGPMRDRTIRRLQDEEGLTGEAAAWAVDVWREALTGIPPQVEAAPPEDRTPGAAKENRAKSAWPGFPTAADVVRDWRAGQQTETVRRAVASVRSRLAGSASEPQTVREQLLALGIPEDITEQMLVKASGGAGETAIVSGISAIVMAVFFWSFDDGWWLKFLLLMGIGSLALGISERRRWRRWLETVAIRRAGVA